MSGMKNPSAKRSHPRNRFAFPDDIDIPEAALNDRKFLSCFVHIFNDPRVYKRRRLNGDRTSSRFDVDNNITIKVIFNEPPVKRKSILANTHDTPKDDSCGGTTRKSVSFLPNVTVIDSVDLDGVSSDWTDIENDESRHNKSGEISKKSKKNDRKSEHRPKKAAADASNGKPSSKNKKKKAKDKSSSSSSTPSSGNRNGHKVKSAQKELFKFKITKPFRKYGRGKEKKLKHLQKKFGRRMFKAFVQVKRSYNLKTIPAKVTVPLEKITLKMNDVTTTTTSTTPITTPVKSVPSIQEFLVGQMTKKVKVSLTPVHGKTPVEHTNEQLMTTTTATIEVASDGNDTTTDEIMQSNEIETNTFETNGTNSIRTENESNVQNDDSLDRQGMENETNRMSETVVMTATAPNEPSGMFSDSDTQIRCSTDDINETIQINGEIVSSTAETTGDIVVQNIVPCNDTEPSPEPLAGRESNALPNGIDDKIACCNNTNNDDIAPTNGRMLVDANDDDVTNKKNDDVDDSHNHQNVTSSFNVSFSMPATKSLTDDNILDGCVSPEIVSIQLDD